MPGEITKLLEEWKGGNAQAGEEVVARTYGELRRVAHAHMRRERPGHTLQTTGLLHEAYLRLLRRGPGSADNREALSCFLDARAPAAAGYRYAVGRLMRRR